MLLFLAFLAVAAANSCTSLAGLSHGMNACVSGEGTPDCTYIQTNANAICSSLLPSWEIVNGPTCSLRGASYGCAFDGTGTFNTQDIFCCVLTGAAAPSDTTSASASATATASPSATVSSSPSATVSSSPSATVSSSPSVTVSASASASASASTSSSSSYTPFVSVTAMVTSSATSSTSPSAFPSYTATSTSTPSPSVTPAAPTALLSAGAYAGIGVGSASAFFLLCACAGYLCYVRRTTPSPERRKSVNSEIIKQARRASQLEIRTPSTPKPQKV